MVLLSSCQWEKRAPYTKCAWQWRLRKVQRGPAQSGSPGAWRHFSLSSKNCRQERSASASSHTFW